MTRVEAIGKLKEILAEATESENSVCYVTKVDAEPLEMAIKALEDDTISRCAVIDALYDWADHSITDAEEYHLKQVAADIKSNSY